MPAFRYGLSVGADVLELDLAVSRDHVLVVAHSPYLTPPAQDNASLLAEAGERRCEGPPVPPGTLIHSLTLAELQQFDCGGHTLPAFPRQIAVPLTPMPTLDEVLALAAESSCEFNVETKIFPRHPSFTPSPEVFVQLIDEAIRRHDLASRIILQSFDFRTLHVMRSLNPEVRLSALIGKPEDDGSAGLPNSEKDFAHVIEVTGAHILSPDQDLVAPESVAIAHALGVQVVPWTVNTPSGWQRMAQAQVDGIITDDPAGCLAWLRSQQPPLHA